MVASAGVRGSQAYTLVAVHEATANVDVSQAYVYVAVHEASANVNASQVYVDVAYKPSTPVDVSQAYVLVAVGGTFANPIIRAWPYTQDGHDMYVIQLGTSGETLVYDLTTQTWANWADADTIHWRPPVGMNWIGSGIYSANYGSDVVVGDNVNGSIYFLDPEYPYDDDRYTGQTDRVAFTAVTTGQVVAKGVSSYPCGIVRLLGSFGETYTGITNTVELQYSDDAGRTFVSAGSVAIADTDYAARVEWRQLGSIKAPGRIFKLIDSGAVTRIDTLEIIDESPESPTK